MLENHNKILDAKIQESSSSTTTTIAVAESIKQLSTWGSIKQEFEAITTTNQKCEGSATTNQDLH